MKQIQCDVPTVFLALFLSRRVHLTLLPSVKGSNLSLFYYQSRFARTSEKKKKKAEKHQLWMRVYKLNLFILPFRACCQFVVSQTNNNHTGQSQLTQQCKARENGPVFLRFPRQKSYVYIS